uniref:Mediator of RNA polymerase II transcription subunit 19 n=1 Tax=Phallusia mammillata TaxID=59560 RepID=A0A6F9DKK5_9ASCI|nr:mediator of RNA polymerase II transcription subunit 19-like [Phallusia mammillata]
MSDTSTMINFQDHSFPYDQISQNLADVPLTHFLTNEETPQTKSQIYLMKDLPPPAQLTGSSNLLAQFGLEATYNKFCGKKLKESLSSFLPDIPGVIDTSEAGNASTLRSIIDKPPIVGSKEIQPLSSATLMAAFRLHPGPVPDQYRPSHQQSETKRKHKHHKSKNRPDVSSHDIRTPEMDEIKKHKKRKHEDGEKKKKKKDKKRKNKEKKMGSGSERSFASGF